MGKRKDRWTAVLEGRYFSALLRLVAEHDLAGGAVHGLDDSEALQLDALAADEVTALLEALLDGDADALDGGTGLLGQLQQTQQGVETSFFLFSSFAFDFLSQLCHNAL